MKRRVLIALLVLIALFAVIWVIRSQFLSDANKVGGVSAQTTMSDRSGGQGAAVLDGVRSVPVKGMVTMLDLGATSCIPCKMMAPIMEKVEKAYKEKAAIIFIDVRKHPDQARKFGIRAIPTQIFFDKNGKEVYRHTGFMNENAIIRQLGKMGVE